MLLDCPIESGNDTLGESGNDTLGESGNDREI